jgi:RNA polymerase primary sigma factor
MEEIAGELKITIADVQETVKIGNNHTSLDAPMQHTENAKLLDTLQYVDQEQPDAFLWEISLHDEINKTLSTLSGREEEIIKLYFGIAEDTAHTLEEIAERFNLTRERVRQIKEKALRRLRHSSRRSPLENYNG